LSPRRRTDSAEELALVLGGLVTVVSTVPKDRRRRLDSGRSRLLASRTSTDAGPLANTSATACSLARHEVLHLRCARLSRPGCHGCSPLIYHRSRLVSLKRNGSKSPLQSPQSGRQWPLEHTLLRRNSSRLFTLLFTPVAATGPGVGSNRTVVHNAGWLSHVDGKVCV
jgi:hypothetical protein